MASSRIVLGAGIAFVVLAAGAAVFVAGGPRQQAPAPSAAELAAAEAHVPPKMTFQPIFEPCAHCHEIGKGARTATGPVLDGIVGRKAGSRNDYPYSQAMKDAGLVWTEANLRQFLQSPGAMVPGTRMAIGGLSDDKIGPLIEFLKTTPTS